MKKILMLASLASLSLPAYAQNPSFLKPNSPASNQSKSSNNNNSQTTNQNNNSGSPYGNEIPVFDPSTESVDVFGKKMSLQDSRLAGQFEGYLVMDQAKIEQAAKYRSTLREILDTVDRTVPGITRKQKLKKAYKLLKVAAEYPADAKICESLQNALVMAQLSINRSQRSDKTIAELKKRNRKLVKTMGFVETRPNFNVAESKSNPETPGGTAATQTKQSNNRSSSEFIDLRKQQSENWAKMRKKDLEAGLAKKLAKVQYQAFLMQLFAQRRFEHVVIGCRLYNLVFNDGEQKLSIKRGADLDKFFSETLGVSPTVAGLDSAANDAIGTASKIAGAVKNHVNRGQVHKGTQRMIEAFALGEHLTPIHTFSPELRSKMAQYITNSKQLKDAAMAKNWQEAEKYVTKLRNLANDFRYITANTAISGYKKASNMQLLQYQIALGNENSKKADSHMREAIDYWPTNPAIEDSITELASRINETKKNLKNLKNTTREFEGIIRNKDYRGLTLKKAGQYEAMFKQAMSDTRIKDADADLYRKHHAEAKRIFTALEAIETAVRTADGYTANGQHYAAWEAIMLEKNNEHLDYTDINAKISDLAPRATKFRELFERASEHIDGRNFGSALTSYLKAKSLYPQSKLAKQGIDTVLKELAP